LSKLLSGFTVGINALERRLDCPEARVAERSNADGAWTPTAQWLRADATNRPDDRIHAIERRLDASEVGLDAGGRFNKIAFSGWSRKGTWVQASQGVAFGRSEGLSFIRLMTGMRYERAEQRDGSDFDSQRRPHPT
jgi:hypothetical protein